MRDEDTASHREQSLYWRKLIELKVYALYARLYRDRLGRYVTMIGVVKAVASSASIAAWAIWQHYAFVWGAIIAASQLLDALKDVFPLTKRYKAVREHAVTLDSLFIDTQFEWDGVFAGFYSNSQITDRLHKLRRLHHDAESQAFNKEGLPEHKDLFKQAQREAAAYISVTYGVESVQQGDSDEEGNHVEFAQQGK